VRFDGSGEIRVQGEALDFQGVEPFTVELWLSKTAVHADYHFPLFKEQITGTNRRGYGIVIIDDYVAGERFVAGNAIDVRATGIGAGRVVYVVMTYSGTTLALYIDAVLADTKPDSRLLLSPVDDLLLIGRSGFDGTIDEVAIYDKVLPVDRIQAHYAARLP
jgi:hypothetical protein